MASIRTQTSLACSLARSLGSPHGENRNMSADTLWPHAVKLHSSLRPLIPLIAEGQGPREHEALRPHGLLAQDVA
jgi:hypothetical protein